MKLIKFILLAFMLNIVCSCEDNKTYNKISISGVGSIEKFDYEGHTYLIRSYTTAYVGWGGMCHDENCKCKTPNKEFAEKYVNIKETEDYKYITTTKIEWEE